MKQIVANVRARLVLPDSIPNDSKELAKVKLELEEALARVFREHKIGAYRMIVTISEDELD